METPKTYVFFGIVGAGKGTQIELLKKVLASKGDNKIVFVAPGVEYRALAAGNSVTGELVRGRLERGELQPDFLTISICTSIMVREMSEGCHLIADAYPRTIEQAEAFYNAMQFYKRENAEIVYIEVSKEEVIRRMKLRGRSDDTDDGINRRFYEYETNVIPAMKNLEAKGYGFHTINGEQSVEAVHADILKVLGL